MFERPDENLASLIAQARRHRASTLADARLQRRFDFDHDTGVVRFIDDVIPDLRLATPARRRWRVTMSAQDFSRAPYVPGRVVARIKQRQEARSRGARSARKGRVLHLRHDVPGCTSPSLVASIAFHVPRDPAEELCIVAIGISDDPSVRTERLAGAWVLKQYVRALAPLTVDPTSNPPRSPVVSMRLPQGWMSASAWDTIRALGFVESRVRSGGRGSIGFRQEPG